MNTPAEQPLPTPPETLFAHLRGLGISYELHRHEPIFTVAQGAHLKKEIPGLHCRNLFLRDKKGRNFLIVLPNERQVDLKKLPALIGADRLSFGSPERLWDYLGVRPGSVCPFSIVNDREGRVEIILDAGMMEAPLVCYHPMENSMTIGLSPEDLVKFIKSCHHAPRILDLEQAAPDGAAQKTAREAE